MSYWWLHAILMTSSMSTTSTCSGLFWKSTLRYHIMIWICNKEISRDSVSAAVAHTKQKNGCDGTPGTRIHPVFVILYPYYLPHTVHQHTVEYFCLEIRWRFSSTVIVSRNHFSSVRLKILFIRWIRNLNMIDKTGMDQQLSVFYKSNGPSKMTEIVQRWKCS